MPDSDGFDLGFRPESYWDSAANGFANIRGEMRRRIIDGALSRGEVPLPSSAFSDELSEAERRLTGSLHPSFMGGEYLPPYLPGEVEIARASLQSVTWDVISIRARRDGTGNILYRVVDEYESDEQANFICHPEQSADPLSFGEIIDFIDNTGHTHELRLGRRGLTSVYRDLNYESIGSGKDGLEYLVNFVRVSSYFYPDLVRWYEVESTEWFVERLSALELEDF
nr:hypothetical protein 9 [Desulfobacterales bacterium]